MKRIRMSKKGEGSVILPIFNQGCYGSAAITSKGARLSISNDSHKINGFASEYAEMRSERLLVTRNDCERCDFSEIE